MLWKLKLPIHVFFQKCDIKKNIVYIYVINLNIYNMKNYGGCYENKYQLHLFLLTVHISVNYIFRFIPIKN